MRRRILIIGETHFTCEPTHRTGCSDSGDGGGGVLSGGGELWCALWFLLSTLLGATRAPEVRPDDTCFTKSDGELC